MFLRKVASRCSTTLCKRRAMNLLRTRHLFSSLLGYDKLRSAWFLQKDLGDPATRSNLNSRREFLFLAAPANKKQLMEKVKESLVRQSTLEVFRLGCLIEGIDEAELEKTRMRFCLHRSDKEFEGKDPKFIQ